MYACNTSKLIRGENFEKTKSSLIAEVLFVQELNAGQWKLLPQAREKSAASLSSPWPTKQRQNSFRNLPLCLTLRLGGRQFQLSTSTAPSTNKTTKQVETTTTDTTRKTTFLPRPVVIDRNITRLV